MTKRNPQAMWITTLANGKFKFTKRYWHTKQGRERTVSTTLTTNSKQAENKALSILNSKIESITNDIDTTDTLFNDAWDEFIEFKSKRWAIGTTKSSMNYYKNHIEPTVLNTYLLTQITFNDIQEVLDTVQYTKNLSRKTTIHVKSLISQVFKYAQKKHHIQASILWADFELKDSIEDPTAEEFIETDILTKEIKKMHDQLPQVYADIIEFQIHTGMRFGEAAAMMSSDLKNNKIKIVKSVDSNDGNRIKFSTKNQGSMRVIDSSDRINEIVSQRILINQESYGADANLLFPNSKNKPIHNHAINKKLKLINVHYTTHTMRHTHISLLVEQGFDLSYIMARVGHTDSQTTLNIYTHITRKLKQKNVRKLDHLF